MKPRSRSQLSGLLWMLPMVMIWSGCMGTIDVDDDSAWQDSGEIGDEEITQDDGGDHQLQDNHEFDNQGADSPDIGFDHMESDAGPDAGCGNGVVEPPGEKCDTVIGQGQSGACPTSCPSGDPCVTGDLQNPGTCQAECAFTNITSCANNDACCPSNCIATNDNDCDPVCGNSVQEPGEKCDTAIASGQPGSCPVFCADTIMCTRDVLLAPGTCQAECSFPQWQACLERPLGYGFSGTPLGRGCCPPNAWYYTWSHLSDYNDRKYLPMIWGGPSCARYTGTCTEAQEQEWVLGWVDFINQDPTLRKGRNWLVWNEPDDSNQAYLNPMASAKLWNRLYTAVKALDPEARLYCCGTHPGWHGPANWAPDWMQTFADNIDSDKTPDGLHYHNYYCGPNYEEMFSGSRAIEVMQGFYSFVQSQPKLANKEIIVTEWAGLSNNVNDRCGGQNNRDNVMRPVATYLNQYGAQINHVATAWFITRYTDFPGCELFDGTQCTCLGDEYKTYVWGQVP